MGFRDVPWCTPCDSIKLFDIPLYSSMCSDRAQRLIWLAVPRYSSIGYNILVYSASFQNRPWLRYSTIFLDIPRYFTYVATSQDRPWHHDIRCHSLRLLDIPWSSSVLSELPRHTMIRISPAILFLVDTADLCLVFVARAAQVPTPPAGDTEIFPM